MFLFDPTIILILPALIFSIWASSKVNSTFKKYSSVYSRSGYTAAMACRAVLDTKGLYHVRIEHIPGNLTDHYDPKDEVIRLSDSVYNSTSAAAIGVACHEAGHAIQHAEEYFPIKVRQAIIPMTRFGSTAGIWIFMIGYLFSLYSDVFLMIGYIGIALFSLTAVFQLVTLPTEYNASRRAVKAINQTGILNEEELDCAKQVLSAAALTYVAALASSLSQLLRFIVLLSGNRRRR